MYSGGIAEGTMGTSRFRIPGTSNAYGYLLINPKGFSSMKIEADVDTIFYTFENGMVSHTSSKTSQTHNISGYDIILYRANGTACYVTFS